MPGTYAARRGRIPRQWRGGIAVTSHSPKTRGLPSQFTRLRRLCWSWWPWSLVCLYALVTDRWTWAAVSATLALLCYIVTPVELPPSYGLVHEYPVESETFLATISGTTGVPFLAGNQLTILNNGDEFYPVMLDAIHAAERSVTIEAYIYWAGDIGIAFAHALADKAQAGVPVKILLDAVGSASIGADILTILEAGGCQLAWYNPARWYAIGRFNHRTHRKSLIIDGEVGFTGGAGIADHWTGRAQSPEHWRDVQVQLAGPGVAPLQSGFAQNWLQSTGELVTGPAYYPPPRHHGPHTLQTILSSPETGSSSVRTMYYLSIVSARRSISIANPYFVPDEVAVQTLLEARQRGVRVRIMVSVARNDNWVARHNSVRLYGSLLRAGVEILEFNRTMLHQKVMVVDDLWCTVGTTNFDSRSFALNEESNVCLRDAGVAGQFQADFDRDAGLCDVVRLEDWRHRGLLARVQESIAALLREQA